MKKLILFATIICLTNSCGKTTCYEARGIEGAGLTIDFINSANNEYFYPESYILYPSIYKLDSLRVRDSNGKVLTTPSQIGSASDNPLKGFYVVDIYPIFIPSDDQAAFTTEQTKTIFIQYNYNTFDTVKIVYKAVKGKCVNEYEYLKAYYRGNLISETSKTTYQGLKFKIKH